MTDVSGTGGTTGSSLTTGSTTGSTGADGATPLEVAFSPLGLGGINSTQSSAQGTASQSVLSSDLPVLTASFNTSTISQLLTISAASSALREQLIKAAALDAKNTSNFFDLTATLDEINSLRQEESALYQNYPGLIANTETLVAPIYQQMATNYANLQSEAAQYYNTVYKTVGTDITQGTSSQYSAYWSSVQNVQGQLQTLESDLQSGKFGPATTSGNGYNINLSGSDVTVGSVGFGTVATVAETNSVSVTINGQTYTVPDNSSANSAALQNEINQVNAAIQNLNNTPPPPPQDNPLYQAMNNFNTEINNYNAENNALQNQLNQIYSSMGSSDAISQIQTLLQDQFGTFTPPSNIPNVQLSPFLTGIDPTTGQPAQYSSLSLTMTSPDNPSQIYQSLQAYATTVASYYNRSKESPMTAQGYYNGLNGNGPDLLMDSQGNIYGRPYANNPTFPPYQTVPLDGDALASVDLSSFSDLLSASGSYQSSFLTSLQNSFQYSYNALPFRTTDAYSNPVTFFLPGFPVLPTIEQSPYDNLGAPYLSSSNGFAPLPTTDHPAVTETVNQGFNNTYQQVVENAWNSPFDNPLTTADEVNNTLNPPYNPLPPLNPPPKTFFQQLAIDLENYGLPSLEGQLQSQVQSLTNELTSYMYSLLYASPDPDYQNLDKAGQPDGKVPLVGLIRSKTSQRNLSLDQLWRQGGDEGAGTQTGLIGGRSLIHHILQAPPSNSQTQAVDAMANQLTKNRSLTSSSQAIDALFSLGVTADQFTSNQSGANLLSDLFQLQNSSKDVASGVPAAALQALIAKDPALSGLSSDQINQLLQGVNLGQLLPALKAIEADLGIKGLSSALLSPVLPSGVQNPTAVNTTTQTSPTVSSAQLTAPPVTATNQPNQAANIAQFAAAVTATNQTNQTAYVAQFAANLPANLSAEQSNFQQQYASNLYNQGLASPQAAVVGDFSQINTPLLGQSVAALLIQTNPSQYTVAQATEIANESIAAAKTDSNLNTTVVNFRADLANELRNNGVSGSTAQTVSGNATIALNNIVASTDPAELSTQISDRMQLILEPLTGEAQASKQAAQFTDLLGAVTQDVKANIDYTKATNDADYSQQLHDTFVAGFASISSPLEQHFYALRNPDLMRASIASGGGVETGPGPQKPQAFV